MRVPDGLKSSPSRVMQRDATSRLKASFFAVAVSWMLHHVKGSSQNGGSITPAFIHSCSSSSSSKEGGKERGEIVGGWVEV